MVALAQHGIMYGYNDSIQARSLKPGVVYADVACRLYARIQFNHSIDPSVRPART